MEENDKDNDVDRFAPQKLLDEFTKSRIVLCVALALAVHVVLIGGSSLEYVYFNWINRDAGIAREEAKKAELEAKKKAEREAAAAARAAKSKTSEKAAEKKPGAEDTDEEMIEKHKDSTVVKEITETATPDEIPDKPDDLGISIEETGSF